MGRSKGADQGRFAVHASWGRNRYMIAVHEERRMWEPYRGTVTYHGARGRDAVSRGGAAPAAVTVRADCGVPRVS